LLFVFIEPVIGTFDPVIDIAFEDDLGPVFELDVHLPVAVRPDHTGRLGVAVSEGEIERRTVLIEIRDLSITADILDLRRLFDERCNPLVQITN
jgi:hypothetical protein